METRAVAKVTWAMQKIYVIGAGQTAQAIFDLIEDECLYEIAAIGLDQEFINDAVHAKYPIIQIDEIPKKSKVFVAVGYKTLNAQRQALYERVKQLGLETVNIISKNAIVRNTATLGKNVLIMEQNNVQAGTRVGTGTYLWSGNHLGHHTSIGRFNYISSHCVISGNCRIGDNNFIGVNTSIGDGLKIGSGCIVGQCAIINQNVEDFSVLKTTGTEILTKSLRFNQRLL